MTIGPQPCPFRPRLVLGELVPAGVLRRLLLGVLFVPSGESDRELREACVERLRALSGPAARGRDHQLADDALVPILLVPVYVDLLPEDHRRQGYLRALPERLGSLGGVDAGDADLVLLVVRVQATTPRNAKFTRISFARRGRWCDDG